MFTYTTLFFSSCSKSRTEPVPVTPEVPVKPVQDEVVITSLSATQGKYNDTVLINGSGFSAIALNNKVLFNGKQAVIAAATTEQLKVTVPLSAGTGLVKVTNGVKSATGPSFKYNYTQLTTVLAGNGTKGMTNGDGKSASFNYPVSLAVTTAGDIFVADQLNNVIRKVTKEGIVSTFAGDGIATSKDGTGVAASFNHPSGITNDKNGNLFVTEVSGCVIRKITPNAVVTTVAGTGIKGYADGNGNISQFGELSGIAVNDNGDLYVTDSYNNTIRKITAAGVVTTYLQTGAQTGVLATIALDNENNIYLTDMSYSDHPYSVNTAYKISNLKAVTPLDVSTPGFDYYGLGGIAVDSKENKYITNTKLQVIKISSTGVTTVISETGINKTTNSLTTHARAVYVPHGITVDEQGMCYIADLYNNKILKVGLQ
ncbi:MULTISPECIES: IPT/TIG domain-containing protein [unclassified Mucilaginibacter]|uniref:IPT/TIG domain-containing protein n=1 Tax=unclassified Mucilaginibacter TaxID=2617802 RepID=UPI003390DEEC